MSFIISFKARLSELKKIKGSNPRFPFRGQGLKLRADSSSKIIAMGGNMFYGSSPIIFANARKLRNELTDSEVIFWGLLRKHFPNYRFKRQHPVSQFIAGFYCHKLKLVIEIDGSIHLSEEARNNDKVRDAFMQSLGLKIIRFTNGEVCKNGELAIEKLNQLIEKITS